MKTIKCFKCGGKTRELIRLVETFRGVQRTQNTINQCITQTCPLYDNFTSKNWVVNKPSDYVKKIKGKKELGNIKVHDSGELRRSEGQSETKNKKNRWPVVGSKGKGIRQMEGTCIGESLGSIKDPFDVSYDIKDDWDERETVRDIEELESEDGDTDSLE